jgi:hypothetical protein
LLVINMKAMYHDYPGNANEPFSSAEIPTMLLCMERRRAQAPLLSIS